MHQRQLIREAIVNTLLNNTDAGVNVLSNQASAHWDDGLNLPAINVTIKSEPVEEFDRAPLSFKRDLFVNIEIVAGANDEKTLTDSLDTIADQVESLLFVDETLNDTCDRILLVNIDMDFREDGARKLGSTKITLICQYVTDLPKVQDNQIQHGNITDLAGVNIDYDIGHHDSDPDGNIDAEDEINL
ncbi:MAG: hypothetical protein COX62_04645 [Deltaproteobacteria bacterium CG_4_10_14_0_2_um_filter_43_8]|nr:MAG: hypothetical protein COV43_04490 [Deltaproteobacteria bacterium CG11_big_fil_rev_8_21_14_0_20_42_23]PJA20534.1 MAG: hypothetical protein COX62_04645 [Deltaproteobacteria bacterium CG_4_10_14_0_2_um_filter_43_8]PJC65033.1 MAG: hypothetical protein CO021_00880 [Deltaproteobacteria bacterium CG_4_9_14_0_2_um_filter_42_21]